MAKTVGTKRVNNKTPNNRNIKNKNEEVTEEIKASLESAVIKDKKITDVKTFGTDTDYIVVEMVATYRNMWNYLHKQKSIQRLKENRDEVEIIPIEFSLEESREFELVMAQTEKIYLDGALVDKTQENILKFADRKGEEFSRAILEMLTQNALKMGKLKAEILLMNTLDRL